MAKIPLPPPGFERNILFTVCVPAGETSELIVSEPGYISIAPTGDFYPDLPTGHVDQGTTEHNPTVSNGDVLLGYFDENKSLVYLIMIQIRQNCDPSSTAS
jgi:hypothetical protein